MASQTKLLDVVEELYTSAIGGRNWTSALVSMSDLFGAVGVSFEIFDKKLKGPVELQLTPNMPEPPREDYMNYYGRISPRFRAGVGKPAGFVAYDQKILSEREMDRNEFYSDCLAPLGLRYFISANILDTHSHHAVVAIQRSQQQGHVSKADIETMELLTPHLKQAAELKYRLSAAQDSTSQTRNVLDHLSEGCIIISQSSDVLYANAYAEEIFSVTDGISLDRKQLHFDDKLAAEKYSRYLADMGSGEITLEVNCARNFIAHRPSGRLPYLISVRPFPPMAGSTTLLDHGTAMILIRDPEIFAQLDIDLLTQVFELSKAEAEIAVRLDKGLTLEEIGRERGVSITTARSQLYALMAKVGVRRQPELLRRLAQFRQPFA